MSRYNRAIIAALLLAGLSLALGAGCASSQQGNARWLQRGEAEALLAAHAATPDKDPDPDRMPAAAGEIEAQGDVLAAQGSSYAAMGQYRLALKDAKGESRQRLEGKLAGLELSLGRYQAAQDGFARLCALQPTQAVFWQGLGLAQMGQGDLAKAETSLGRAVELDPSLWRAQNLRGVIHNRRRQPRLAMADFQAALRVRPDNPALYNNLALSQAMVGDLSGAEVSLRRALALDPEHRLAANNLGLVLVRQGRDEEAFQLFAQSQGVAQAHNNLGVILAWQGRTREAQEQFQAAVQSLPRYYPLASRHLKQLGPEPFQAASNLLARPMTPLTEGAENAPAVQPRPRASVKATPAVKKAPAKIKNARPARKQAPAKTTPQPQAASLRKPPAQKQAQASPLDSAPQPAPAAQGAKPPALAKPAPQVKPAPISKEQRLAAPQPQPQPAKAEAKPSAAPPKAVAPVAGEKPAPASPPVAASEQTSSTAPSASGQAAGLWMRSDGSLSYGPMPAGERAYGVVFGSR